MNLPYISNIDEKQNQLAPICHDLPDDFTAQLQAALAECDKERAEPPTYDPEKMQAAAKSFGLPAELISPDGEPTEAERRAVVGDPKAIAELFPFPDDFQSQILGSLLQDCELLRLASAWLDPGHFTNHAQQIICKLAVDHFNRFDKPPTKAELETEIVARLSDECTRARVLGEMDHCLAAWQPEIEARGYTLEKITEFAKTKAIKRVYDESATLLDGRKPERFEIVRKKLNDALAVFDQQAAGEFSFLDLLSDDLLEATAADWIIPDFLPAGNSLILGGAAKAGKSVLALWLIRQLTYGEDFLGKPTMGPRPVLYLDWENPPRYMAGWANKFVKDKDKARWKELVSYATVSAQPDAKGVLPSYLTVEFLNGIIKDRPQGLIIVDTVRGAFGSEPNLLPNWENSSSEIARLVRPITCWAHKTGWAVIFLHHLNKQDKLSGSTDLLAACDLVCHFWRDVDNGGNACSFTVLGRLPAPIGKRLMTFTGDGFEFEGAAAVVQEERKAQAKGLTLKQHCKELIDVMGDGRDYRAHDLKQLAQTYGLSRDAYYAAVDVLAARNVIEKSGDARAVRYRSFSGADGMASSARFEEVFASWQP